MTTTADAWHAAQRGAAPAVDVHRVAAAAAALTAEANRLRTLALAHRLTGFTPCCADAMTPSCSCDDDDRTREWEVEMAILSWSPRLDAFVRLTSLDDAAESAADVADLPEPDPTTAARWSESRWMNDAVARAMTLPLDPDDLIGAPAPARPEVGPRCGACRLGLPTHDTADPLCEAKPPTFDVLVPHEWGSPLTLANARTAIGQQPNVCGTFGDWSRSVGKVEVIDVTADDTYLRFRVAAVRPARRARVATAMRVDENGETVGSIGFQRLHRAGDGIELVDIGPAPWADLIPRAEDASAVPDESIETFRAYAEAVARHHAQEPHACDLTSGNNLYGLAACGHHHLFCGGCGALLSTCDHGPGMFAEAAANGDLAADGTLLPEGCVYCCFYGRTCSWHPPADVAAPSPYCSPERQAEGWRCGAPCADCPPPEPDEFADLRDFLDHRDGDTIRQAITRLAEDSELLGADVTRETETDRQHIMSGASETPIRTIETHRHRYVIALPWRVCP